MKQLLLFALLLFLTLTVDLKPFDLQALQTDIIHVYVQGEVEQEGVLELSRYATVEEALAHMVLNDQADCSMLNPLQILHDRDVIYIPRKKAETEERRISINIASTEQLSTLPGIGLAMAERIISFRTENGLFQTLEDLQKVKGIGPRLFEKLKDRICL